MADQSVIEGQLSSEHSSTTEFTDTTAERVTAAKDKKQSLYK